MLTDRQPVPAVNTEPRARSPMIHRDQAVPVRQRV